MRQEIAEVLSEVEELRRKLAKAEARAEFWREAALDWKARYATQIIAEPYPPRMAAEVLAEKLLGD